MYKFNNKDVIMHDYVITVINPIDATERVSGKLSSRYSPETLAVMLREVLNTEYPFDIRELQPAEQYLVPAISLTKWSGFRFYEETKVKRTKTIEWFDVSLKELL